MIAEMAKEEMSPQQLELKNSNTVYVHAPVCVYVHGSQAGVPLGRW